MFTTKKLFEVLGCFILSRSVFDGQGDELKWLAKICPQTFPQFAKIVCRVFKHPLKHLLYFWRKIVKSCRLHCANRYGPKNFIPFHEPSKAERLEYTLPNNSLGQQWTAML